MNCFVLVALTQTQLERHDDLQIPYWPYIAVKRDCTTSQKVSIII